MFWSDINDRTGISVLAQYCGCSCCTTVAMTIMSIVPGPVLLLSSGISVPDVLLAIPWRVLLWHALGLVGIWYASAFIEF